jgi:hypothetical protein
MAVGMSLAVMAASYGEVAVTELLLDVSVIVLVLVVYSMVVRTAGTTVVKVDQMVEVVQLVVVV